MTTEKPLLVELEMREADVEAVFLEYQAANPSKTPRDMTPDEFAERMLKKILATATVIEGGNS
jgi:hypothetical protein